MDSAVTLKKKSGAKKGSREEVVMTSSEVLGGRRKDFGFKSHHELPEFR